MTSKSGYNGLQITLHWLIAILILVNYFFAEGMEDIFDGMLEGKPVEGNTATVHIYVGLAVLALALVRIVVRLTSGAPAAAGAGLMDKAAQAAHGLLYLLMIAVPALGAIAWYKGLDAFAAPHVLAMNAMMLIALIHAAAALFHQFVLKDGLLMRMLRPQ